MLRHFASRDRSRVIRLTLLQFAQLLAHPPSKWELEIHHVFDRMESSGPHYYRTAIELMQQLVAATLTKAEARAQCHTIRGEAAELEDRARKMLARQATLADGTEQEKMLKRAQGLIDNAWMTEKFVKLKRFDLDGVAAASPASFAYLVGGVEVCIRPELCFIRDGRPQFAKLVLSKVEDEDKNSARNVLGSKTRAAMRKLMFGTIAAKQNVDRGDIIVLNVFIDEKLEGQPLDAEFESRIADLGRTIEAVHAARAAARAKGRPASRSH